MAEGAGTSRPGGAPQKKVASRGKKEPQGPVPGLTGATGGSGVKDPGPSHQSPGSLGPIPGANTNDLPGQRGSHSKRPHITVLEHARAVDLLQSLWELWVEGRKGKNEAGPSWAA